MEMGGQRHAPAALPRKRAGTHCIGGWVGTRPVWTGAEIFDPTGIQSPDRPARSNVEIVIGKNVFTIQARV